MQEVPRFTHVSVFAFLTVFVECRNRVNKILQGFGRFHELLRREGMSVALETPIVKQCMKELFVESNGLHLIPKAFDQCSNGR